VRFRASSLWTRKEAFVKKAVGKGIDEDFKNIPCLDGQHFPNIVQKSTSWHAAELRS
jgi:4'-phosphopantetheinyl transferase